MDNLTGNVCAHCGKDLRMVEEIHVVEGQHFCTKACAVHEQMDVIVASAKDTATEWYDECAEIVTPQDIGIVYEKVWTAYSREADLTTILKSKYLDKEHTETISTEIVGFYWGTPNDEDTEKYTGVVRDEY